MVPNLVGRKLQNKVTDYRHGHGGIYKFKSPSRFRKIEKTFHINKGIRILTIDIPQIPKLTKQQFLLKKGDRDVVSVISKNNTAC